jgi:hypothetical protein
MRQAKMPVEVMHRLRGACTVELTFFLSKVFGIGLIITGAAIAIRRRYFIPVFGAFVEERLVRAVVSFAELIGGLFLVIAHNVWSPLPAAIISFLGWMAVIEATAYLLLPDDMLEKFIGTFNVPAWYLVGGIFAILVGIYLAGFGFGWW